MRLLTWLSGLAASLRSVLDFAVFWTLTLPWTKIAISLPFWISLLFAGVIWWDGEDRVRELNYLTRRLSQALQNEDYDAAKLLIDRKLTLDPKDADAQFQRALIMASNQETDAATRLMFQLALADGRAEELAVAPEGPDAISRAVESIGRFRFGDGNPQAGKWLLANHYAPKLGGKLNALDVAVLDAMLPWLNEKFPTEASLANLYAERLLALRMFAEAVPVIERVADQSALLRLKAAVLSRSAGAEEKAKGHAEQALAALRLASTTAPESFDNRMMEAGCLGILERYPEAIDAIRVADRLAKTDDQRTQARNKAAQVWVVWSGQLIANGGMKKSRPAGSGQPAGGAQGRPPRSDGAGLFDELPAGDGQGRERRNGGDPRVAAGEHQSWGVAFRPRNGSLAPRGGRRGDVPLGVGQQGSAQQPGDPQQPGLHAGEPIQTGSAAGSATDRSGVVRT